MNALHAYQTVQAAATRRAVPKAMRRHVHLSARPLVLCGYHLAGDPGAVLALMWGTSHREQPHCMVVPEPRNRSLRFEALDEFATQFLAYLSQFEGRDETGMCLDAPQLVVPNAATADWLGGIVGRFTRNLRLDGDAPAPASVPMVGKHLSFFADLLPGSSLVLAATDALSNHWQTGQLPSEDLNLAALLGWIDPPVDMDGPQAALAGEASPPAGPNSDPVWDATSLVELNQEWHAANDDASRSATRRDLDSEIRAQLSPAWNGCWKALDCIGSLPTADRVASRWQSDRKDWTYHCDRVAENRAHFRNVRTPVGDARRIRMAEARTAALEREMAWDDPLVMAAVVASGEALAGRVVEVDSDRRGKNAKGTTVRRPLIAIEPTIEFARPLGTTLFLSTNPSVMLELLPSDANGPIQAEVLKGANTNRTVERLPNLGDEVVLSPYGELEYYSRSTIDHIPWTHQQVLDQESSE